MWSRIALLVLGFALATGGVLSLTGGAGQRAGAAANDIHPPGVEAVNPPRPQAQEPPVGDTYCLTCHSNESLSTGLADGSTLSLYVDARLVRDSAHELLTCVSCHEENKICPPERKEPLDLDQFLTRARDNCAGCHEAGAEGFEGSDHWTPEFEEGKGATCIECHSPDSSGHSIVATSTSESILAPSRIAASCGRCHRGAMDSYNATSHGKVARLGDARSTATCTTCHGDHPVGAAEELLESPGIGQLTSSCGSCHEGADSDFARAWPGHSANGGGRSASGFLWKTGYYVGVAIVGFGLAHMSFDLVRRRREQRDEGR